MAGKPIHEKKLKALKKEGGKRGIEIQGASEMGGMKFFCTHVEKPAGDLEQLRIVMDAMNVPCPADMEERRGGAGLVGKMVFSHNKDQVAVCAHVPKKFQASINIEEWIKYVLETVEGEFVEVVDEDVSDEGGQIATGVAKANPDNNLFTLKMRDTVLSHSIQFLQKLKDVNDDLPLFPADEDSDDDFVYGDDDLDF
mmetsp:Transcript_12663/g.29915  ORF Transcript_12663/g.29915 Transcript_12663/m.29915 type:complete len:197 (+) Transcript_12663:65-655(+)